MVLPFVVCDSIPRPVRSQVTELNVMTPSTVPPSFTVTAVSNFTEGNATLIIATNETAIVYYLVMLGQATAVPSAGQVCAHTIHLYKNIMQQLRPEHLQSSLSLGLSVQICISPSIYLSDCCVCLRCPPYHAMPSQSAQTCFRVCSISAFLPPCEPFHSQSCQMQSASAACAYDCTGILCITRSQSDGAIGAGLCWHHARWLSCHRLGLFCHSFSQS